MRRHWIGVVRLERTSLIYWSAVAIQLPVLEGVWCMCSGLVFDPGHAALAPYLAGRAVVACPAGPVPVVEAIHALGRSGSAGTPLIAPFNQQLIRATAQPLD